MYLFLFLVLKFATFVKAMCTNQQIKLYIIIFIIIIFQIFNHVLYLFFFIFSLSSHAWRNPGIPFLASSPIENSTLLLADVGSIHGDKKSGASAGSSSAGDKQSGRPSEEQLDKAYKYLSEIVSS